MNVHARPDGATILLREDKDGIATLTLNRPAALNSFTGAMHEQLLAALNATATDAAVRALIVTGALCGIAGAYLSIAQSAGFTRDMTAGKGSLALAALRDTLLPKLISGELRVKQAVRLLEAALP